MNQRFVLLLSILWLNACSFFCAPVGGLEYPKTERIDCVDEYFGVKVDDPYRWLEEDLRQSQRVRDWVGAQNKVAFDYLKSLPGRKKIKARLGQLWDYDKYGVPSKAGGRYYISIHKGLQNHPVVYKMDSPDGKRQILFNPNKWSQDGTTALAGMSFSEDGRYVAYAIQQDGSDWKTWKVRDIQKGEDLADTLNYLKFTSPAWDGEAKGFFYSKYPDPEPSGKFTALTTRMKVMYHRLGTRQQEDVPVFYRPDHPEWNYAPIVSDDGRYLILIVWVGSEEGQRVMYRDLRQQYAMPVDLIDNFENEYTFIDNDEDVFYFSTNQDAPNGRIIAIDTGKPEGHNRREVIPQSEEPMLSSDLINETFVCVYLKDVATKVRLFSMEGRFLREIALPGLGMAAGFEGKRKDCETFYRLESFTAPPCIYRYDIAAMESKLLEKSEIDIASEAYITEQVFYPSKDGTKIPMFITYRKDIKRDGSNPTLLCGYGGYNISLQSRFSSSLFSWLEMGGVYAVANLRGGGEYGKTWHDAGKKMNKQNVFDDFIAAAEYLTAKKYCHAGKLAIEGGSNGGLLVGACMTQHPELFAAAVPHMGVMDMLRFDEFTAGRGWVDEFGSAKESKEMFEYLKGYSPYHNLKPGVSYPATLVITADTDDRVVPGHSFKFAARLQNVQAGDKPVLIRIETQAGHGSGKPTSMRIEERADIYAFLAANLGMCLD